MTNGPKKSDLAKVAKKPVSPAAASATVALGANRNSARTPVQNRRSGAPDRPLHPRPLGHRLAMAISVLRTRLVL